MLLRTMPEPELPCVELARKPSISPQAVGQWAINLLMAGKRDALMYGPFPTEREAHECFARTFGKAEHTRWFPELYREPHQTCGCCTRHRAVAEFVGGRCLLCRESLALHVQEGTEMLDVTAGILLALAAQYSSRTERRRVQ